MDEMGKSGPAWLASRPITRGQCMLAVDACGYGNGDVAADLRGEGNGVWPRIDADERGYCNYKSHGWNADGRR